MYLFPNGKRQGTRFVVGNVQGDAGDSLVIELEGPKRGLWIAFATGESGDVLALWAAARGFAVPSDFGELLDDVGDWLVVPTSFIPAQAKSSAAHDTLGPHTGKWDCYSADGNYWLACTATTHPRGSNTGPGTSPPVRRACPTHARSITCLR